MDIQIRVLLVITALLGVITAPQAHCQRAPNMRSGNSGSASPYNRLYDTKNVETICGEVVASEQINPIKGLSAGVHVQLKTLQGTVSVHFGQAGFNGNQDVSIEVKDSVEIKGSRDMFDVQSAVIASKMNPPRRKQRGITERGFAPIPAGGIHPRSKLRGILPSRLKRTIYSSRFSIKIVSLYGQNGANNEL